jgi:hypothetical protein
MNEIQWLIYDSNIFISLIYKKVENWLHVDFDRKPNPRRKYDFRASDDDGHIIIAIIFEAKKITTKEWWDWLPPLRV